jgi:hypothetical protein
MGVDNRLQVDMGFSTAIATFDLNRTHWTKYIGYHIDREV